MQSLPLDILHRDEPDSAGLAQIENSNYVSIGDLASKNQFLLEALKDFRIAGEFGPDNFESNDAIEFKIFRFVYRTHATFAEDLQYFVTASDNCPGLKQRRSKGASRRGCALSR